MTLAPDLALGGRYTLVERIAVGGMGEVWRARDELLGRTVAVKVLKEEYAADPSFLQRFRDEARHTAALSHPGIANVFDYGEVGETAYLVMELVDGAPLTAPIAERAPLPPGEVMDVVGQAALALQAAHDAGVIHRDVKPGNLLLRRDGVVKVTDFGIARAVDSAPVTQTGMLVGTAAYLSPEQAAGRPVTGASDVYSLGVVAYECLSGQRPFQADSAIGVALAHANTAPPALPTTVPPLVADFVMRALDKDPARRQSSAGDFGRTALALAAQLREPPGGAGPPAVPTAVMPDPSATATAIAPAPSASRAAPAADEAARRRIRNIFIGVGTAVVVVGFLLLYSCTGPSRTALARVPRVTGEDYAQAAAALRHRGFTVARHDTHTLAAGRGVVTAQSAPAGRRLPVDRTITLTVSAGPPRTQVRPADYVGRQAAPVVAELRAKHLQVRLSSAAGDGAPGTVTAIDPTGSVKEGTTVTVTVAAAAPPQHGHGHGPKPPKPPKHGHGKPGHGD